MDPLIHGPSGGSPGAPTSSSYDLNSTNPLEDLIQLFRSPRSFFSLFMGGAKFSGWVYAKAVMGLLFFSWLNEFASGGRWVGGSFQEAIGFLQYPPLSTVFRPSDLEAIQSQLLALMVGVSQLKLVISPFIDLFDTAGLAATTTLFLPWMGVPRSKDNFNSIFLALCYVRWFYVLGVIPAIGTIICPMAIAIFTIQAVRWTEQISFMKSFFVTYGVYWLSIFILFALLIGATFLLLLS